MGKKHGVNRRQLEIFPTFYLDNDCKHKQAHLSQRQLLCAQLANENMQLVLGALRPEVCAKGSLLLFKFIKKTGTKMVNDHDGADSDGGEMQFHWSVPLEHKATVAPLCLLLLLPLPLAATLGCAIIYSTLPCYESTMMPARPVGTSD